MCHMVRTGQLILLANRAWVGRWRFHVTLEQLLDAWEFVCWCRPFLEEEILDSGTFISQ